MVPLDKGLQQVNVKQKPFRQIQEYLGIIRYIQESFKHIQAYLEPCCFQNPDIFGTRGIFRNLTYSEPWYIQHPDIFKTLAYSKSKTHSELCQTFTMKHLAKIVSGYNHFCSISLPRSLLHKINIMNFFNAGLIFTSELVILCRKLWRAREPGTVNFLFKY